MVGGGVVVVGAVGGVRKREESKKRSEKYRGGIGRDWHGVAALQRGRRVWGLGFGVVGRHWLSGRVLVVACKIAPA